MAGRGRVTVAPGEKGGRWWDITAAPFERGGRGVGAVGSGVGRGVRERRLVWGEQGTSKGANLAGGCQLYARVDLKGRAAHEGVADQRDVECQAVINFEVVVPLATYVGCVQQGDSVAVLVVVD
jgi:hypothetical protein